MSKIKDFLKSPLGTALCAAAACLLAVVLVWLAAVRPNNDKSLSERISDDYSQYSAELDEASLALPRPLIPTMTCWPWPLCLAPATANPPVSCTWNLPMPTPRGAGPLHRRYGEHCGRAVHRHGAGYPRDRQRRPPLHG